MDVTSEQSMFDENNSKFTLNHGHQVSPQMSNQQSAEGMEGAGNAAAMFQDFNECVNRVLSGR